MANDVADNLDRAADLLEQKGWTKGTFARGKSGRPVKPLGRSAVCFCALGAIWRATGRDWQGPEYHVFLSAIQREAGITWNDAGGRTREDVVTKLREAARIARAGALADRVERQLAEQGQVS